MRLCKFRSAVTGLESGWTRRQWPDSSGAIWAGRFRGIKLTRWTRRTWWTRWARWTKRTGSIKVRLAKAEYIRLWWAQLRWTQLKSAEMWEEGLSALQPQLIVALVVHQVALKTCFTRLRYLRGASFDHVPRIWNKDIAPTNGLGVFSCQGELNRGPCHSVNQWTRFWYQRLKSTAELS